MAAQKKKRKPVKISIISSMADLMTPETEYGELQELADILDEVEDDIDPVLYDVLNHLFSAVGGELERIEFTTDGTLSDDGKRIEISYEESELCGMAGSRTTLLFDKVTPGLVTMVRTGTHSSSLVFNAADRRQRCMYDTGIIPPFELCVLTRSIDNSLSYEGGKLALDYIIEMRGVKTEYNNLLMEVRELKPPSLGIQGR
ncbi:MAG: DUF1934 domain-containing protein [Eubacteriales bacterium]|nr:DUF1934 domain-containing protein [Eubacteriales bacterium]